MAETSLESWQGVYTGFAGPLSLFVESPGCGGRKVVFLSDSTYEAEALELEHSYSPLGRVEIDIHACTGCKTCAAGCPTNALAY